jgi:hypothetical protein
MKQRLTIKELKSRRKWNTRALLIPVIVTVLCGVDMVRSEARIKRLESEVDRKYQLLKEACAASERATIEQEKLAPKKAEAPAQEKPTTTTGPLRIIPDCTLV